MIDSKNKDVIRLDNVSGIIDERKIRKILEGLGATGIEIKDHIRHIDVTLDKGSVDENTLASSFRSQLVEVITIRQSNITILDENFGEENEVRVRALKMADGSNRDAKGFPFIINQVTVGSRDDIVIIDFGGWPSGHYQIRFNKKTGFAEFCNAPDQMGLVGPNAVEEALKEIGSPLEIIDMVIENLDLKPKDSGNAKSDE